MGRLIAVLCFLILPDGVIPGGLYQSLHAPFYNLIYAQKQGFLGVMGVFIALSLEDPLYLSFEVKNACD